MAKKKNHPNRPISKSHKKMVTTVNKPPKHTIQPTVSRSEQADAPSEMLFGKENFLFLGIGAALVVVGLLLMSGGQQAPDEWNPDVIYSSRRLVLAPIIILVGLGAVLYSIFKKTSETA